MPPAPLPLFDSPFHRLTTEQQDIKIHEFLETKSKQSRYHAKIAERFRETAGTEFVIKLKRDWDLDSYTGVDLAERTQAHGSRFTAFRNNNRASLDMIALLASIFGKPIIPHLHETLSIKCLADVLPYTDFLLRTHGGRPSVDFIEERLHNHAVCLLLVLHSPLVLEQWVVMTQRYSEDLWKGSAIEIDHFVILFSKRCLRLMQLLGKDGQGLAPYFGSGVPSGELREQLFIQLNRLWRAYHETWPHMWTVAEGMTPFFQSYW